LCPKSVDPNCADVGSTQERSDASNPSRRAIQETRGLPDPAHPKRHLMPQDSTLGGPQADRVESLPACH